MVELEAWTVILIPLNDLKPHEEIEESRVTELIARIKKEGVVREAVLVDYKTLIVLDGHHRVEALKRLGCKLAPVLLVDYDSDCVSISSWRDNITVTKEDVKKAGLTGRLMPPKTSRHRLCFQPPSISVSLKQLMDSERAYVVVMNLRETYENSII